MGVAKKVVYFKSISRLGFKSETPLGFLRKEWIYHLVVWLLFSGVLVSSLFTLRPWWVGLIGLMILCLFLLIANIAGRNSALKKYREVLKEMIEFEEDEDQVQEYQSLLEKSDTEIWAMRT